MNNGFLLRVLFLPIILYPDFCPVSAQNFVWEATNFPRQGPRNIRALTFTTPGTAIAGTSGQGLFRSFDSAATWQVVNTGVIEPYIVTLESDSLENVFAGTINGYILKSSNGGLTWGTCYTPPTLSTTVFTLKRSTNHDVLAGTAAGILRSTDNGTSWSHADSGFVNITVVYSLGVSVAPISFGHLFAGTNNGMYMSTDLGEHWNVMPNSLPLGSIFVLAINQSGHIFAATELLGVFRSTDAGITWIPINTGLPSAISYAIVTDSVGKVFVGTGAGVYRSTNNGDSWTFSSPSLAVYSLAKSRSGLLLSGTDPYGVYRSTNGGVSWQPTGSARAIYATTIDQGNRVLAADYSGLGVFRTSDYGNNWTSLGLNRIIPSLLVSRLGRIFAGLNPGLGRTTNDGQTWTEMPSGLPNAYVYALAQTRTGRLLVALSSNSVYRSDNEGDSWIRSDTGITYPNARAFAVDSINNIYVAANPNSFPLPPQFGGIFKSVNDGASWTRMGTFDKIALSLAINQQGFIFAGTISSGVFVSTDGGVVWNSSNIGLTSLNIQTIAINKQGIVLVGTLQGGVFASTNNGGSWVHWSLNLPPRNVYSIAFDSSSVAYIGTEDGVYRSSGPTTPVHEFAGATPNKPDLQQNFPNPFNPTTTVGFTLSHDTEISLRVFDILGRLITTLVNEERSAGLNRVTFDGQHLATGTYFYELRSANLRVVRRMTLIK